MNLSLKLAVIRFNQRREEPPELDMLKTATLKLCHAVHTGNIAQAAKLSSTINSVIHNNRALTALIKEPLRPVRLPNADLAPSRPSAKMTVVAPAPKPPAPKPRVRITKTRVRSTKPRPPYEPGAGARKMLIPLLRIFKASPDPLKVSTLIDAVCALQPERNREDIANQISVSLCENRKGPKPKFTLVKRGYYALNPEGIKAYAHIL